MDSFSKAGSHNFVAKRLEGSILGHSKYAAKKIHDKKNRTPAKYRCCVCDMHLLTMAAVGDMHWCWIWKVEGMTDMYDTMPIRHRTGASSYDDCISF